MLGLDFDASPESIKLAYRRMAREHHPDLVQHLPPEAVQQAAAAMLAINEAYATLSNAQTRRQYDATLRGVAPPPAAEVAEEAVVAPAAPARARVRGRPGTELLSSVVGVFSNQLRSDLLAKLAEFKWRDRDVEGFHWAMHSSSWTSDYMIALRGFAAADLDAATKFTNYCDVAIAHSKSLFKQSYFLFFLPFQKSSNTDSIAAALRRFCGNEQQQRTPAPVMIVMTDVQRGKALLCGPPIRDRRYEHILDALHLSRGD